MPHSTLAAITQDPIANDLAATDALLLSEIDSRVPLIKTIATHLIGSGGKRLRPRLVLLAARCLGYNEGTEHLELATVIEFIHSATLLHDDVIDHSTQRRGEATVNAIWDNTAAVLVGDFLYSRAFQILARRSNVPVMRVLANATNRLSEAEILQLSLTTNPDISEQDYFDVISGKTAELYAAAAEIGAIIATNDIKARENLRLFGWQLGMAFQIIDDVLDYSAKQQQLGKNLGDDLSEGKTTLPIIMALKNATPAQQVILRHAIQTADKNQLSAVLTILTETNALQNCAAIAYEFIAKANSQLNNINESPFKKALLQLTDFVLHREY